MKYSTGIIICTYNRAESLKDTLDSLLKQECDWSGVAEIIIVDNNSTDGTEKLISSYAAVFKTELKYLKETRQGKSYALNLAISTSRSDVLVFTDDDVVLDPQWLKEIMRFFNTNEADVVGGRVLPLYPPQTPLWVKKNQYALRGAIVSYDNGEDIIDYSSGRISQCIGANVAYKRSVFEATGLFNTDLGPGQGTYGDDVEMFDRAVRAGKKIFYDGKALVWHTISPQRMTLRYIAGWNFQHGKSAGIIEAMRCRQGLPSIGGVPRYLLRGVVLKLAKLLLTIFRPGSFLKCFGNLYFNSGVIAGHAQYNRCHAPQKD